MPLEKFFKIQYGEEGKARGTIFVNINKIRYIQYHEKNEAIPKTAVVPDAGEPFVEIFMNEGRRTFMFSKNDYEKKTVVCGDEI